MWGGAEVTQGERGGIAIFFKKVLAFWKNEFKAHSFPPLTSADSYFSNCTYTYFHLKANGLKYSQQIPNDPVL